MNQFESTKIVPARQVAGDVEITHVIERPDGSAKSPYCSDAVLPAILAARTADDLLALLPELQATWVPCRVEDRLRNHWGSECYGCARCSRPVLMRRFFILAWAEGRGVTYADIEAIDAAGWDGAPHTALMYHQPFMAWAEEADPYIFDRDGTGEDGPVDTPIGVSPRTFAKNTRRTVRTSREAHGRRRFWPTRTQYEVLANWMQQTGGQLPAACAPEHIALGSGWSGGDVPSPERAEARARRQQVWHDAGPAGCRLPTMPLNIADLRDADDPGLYVALVRGCYRPHCGHWSVADLPLGHPDIEPDEEIIFEFTGEGLPPWPRSGQEEVVEEDVWTPALYRDTPGWPVAEAYLRSWLAESGITPAEGEDYDAWWHYQCLNHEMARRYKPWYDDWKVWGYPRERYPQLYRPVTRVREHRAAQLSDAWWMLVTGQALRASGARNTQALTVLAESERIPKSFPIPGSDTYGYRYEYRPLHVVALRAVGPAVWTDLWEGASYDRMEFDNHSANRNVFIRAPEWWRAEGAKGWMHVDVAAYVEGPEGRVWNDFWSNDIYRWWRDPTRGEDALTILLALRDAEESPTARAIKRSLQDVDAARVDWLLDDFLSTRHGLVARRRQGRTWVYALTDGGHEALRGLVS